MLGLMASVSQVATVERVVSVYDADTFRVDIHNWPDPIGLNMPIRVKSVDAPEIRGKCANEKAQAKAARDYVRKLLGNADRIELLDIERGKYFRLLARVRVDGKDLARLLVIEGHARPYDGGAREGWCF